MENSQIQLDLSTFDIPKVVSEMDLKEASKVGDLGCGFAGYFTFPLSKAVGEKGLVYAVDVVKSALQNIENKAKLDSMDNIRTVWSNLEIYNATKIESESLDAILLKNVLYQVKEKKAFLKESDRLLKRGGTAIIIDWQMTNAPMGPPLDHRVKKEEIMALATELGWQFIEEFSPGKYYFGLKFTK